MFITLNVQGNNAIDSLYMEAIARKNKITFFYFRSNIEQFEREYPDYMEFAKKNKLWEDYFTMFNYRTSLLCRQEKFDEAIDEAEKLLSSAKELNLPFALGTLYRCFGQIYFYQQRYDLAEVQYIRALSYFQQAQNLQSALEVYRDLANALQAQNKYQKLEIILSDMEKTYQKFVDQLGEDDLPTLFQIHRIHISIYVYNKQFDQALVYINKIETYIDQLPESAYNYFQFSLLGFFKAQEKYAQALTVVDSLYRYYVKTNQKLYSLRMMAEQIELLSWLNRGSEVVEIFAQYYKMRTAMEMENTNLKFDQLRNKYEAEKLAAEKKRGLYYFLFTLGSAFLLAIALGIWIYNRRTIIRKNRDLYRQIKEQDRMAMPLPGSSQQRQLVSHLRERLLRDRYFATSDIDIQKLVTEMAISRTPLFEAVKAVTGHTPMEFISHLRLEEAKRLLDHSSLTIEAIASECGFSTLSTFYRQFRERYSITPAEYRKVARSG
ncbi:MAG: helix-turn-helix domain-containing protein [Lentimicrobiaceae bacterium]|nr:helix-turn-helix domain-containing protein [Lentimicrobiaceae bacterium]